MSRKANPTLVGVFVLGSLALLVCGLLFFGGGQFLRLKNDYVMYFSGSVSGLRVGAPVNFRGVNIGTVIRVEVELDVRDAGIKTPVFIEIDRAKFRAVGGEIEEPDADRILDILVERGLRAKLVAESFVTGLKAVEFDFFPDTPIRLVGDSHGKRELPTVASEFEQLAAELTGIPIGELAETAESAMRGVESLVRSPEFQQLPEEVSDALADLRTLLRNLDTGLAPLISSLEKTSATTSGVMTDVREILRDENGPIFTLSAELERTSQATRGAMERAQEALATLEGTLEGTSGVQYELTLALREITAAARSLRRLAESLEQNPEALLRGKSRSGVRQR